MNEQKKETTCPRCGETQTEDMLQTDYEGEGSDGRDIDTSLGFFRCYCGEIVTDPRGMFRV